jgi:uncharacterized membrane protein
MLFTTLKFIHVCLAIVAIGYNASYGLLIGRARSGGIDGREMRFALRTIKVMDDYVANPCYGLLLVTGGAMVYFSGYPWTLKWIYLSLALLIVAFVIALVLYTPTLRRQIEVLESSGPSDPEFLKLSTRGAALGGVLGVIVVVILALMIFKPQ